MINIENIDVNECFKWCLVRYLNPADDYPARFTNTDKDFAETLDFKSINFPVKILTKLKKKVFVVKKIKKSIQSMY